MKYWFVYELESKKIRGTPYLGQVDTWSNIPTGCGVVGPIDESNPLATDAFQNPEFYTVVNEILTANLDIDQAKAHKFADIAKENSVPKVEDRIASLEAAMLSMMGL